MTAKKLAAFRDLTKLSPISHFVVNEFLLAVLEMDLDSTLNGSPKKVADLRLCDERNLV